VVHVDRFVLSRVVLRREQGEQLESGHRENRTTGKERDTVYRRHTYIPQGRRNGGAPVCYSGRRPQPIPVGAFRKISAARSSGVF
jgi:hypothetical protein